MKVENVKTDLIDPGRVQVRKEIDEEKISELADSIKEVDILSLPILEKHGNRYRIIAGERRRKAALQADLSEILAVVREDLSDFERRLISASENIHREDLTSDERENLIHGLWREGKEEGVIETQEDLAEKLGINRSSVSYMCAAHTFRKKHNMSPDISTRAISDTAGLPEEDRVKILEKHEKGLVEAASIREYTRIVKEASEPVKEALLDVDFDFSPKEARTIDSELESARQKETAIQALQREKKESLEYVIEVSRERPRKPVLIDEIDTGFVWGCPFCGKEYHLIHKKKGKEADHSFEEVVE